MTVMTVDDFTQLVTTQYAFQTPPHLNRSEHRVQASEILN